MIRDVRVFRYVLTPVQVRPPEEVLREGEQLREYGKTIGSPVAEPNPPLAPAPVLGGPVQ